MPNSYFRFKQFTVHHDRCAMKVATDACLFGAWAAQEIKQGNTGNKTALDIGTGTGLLSLMILQKNTLQLDAIEIDLSAAEQAKENIEATPWRNNINVYLIDALDYEYSHQYDIIVSNPPFYEKEIESIDVQKNKAHHGHALRLQQLAALLKKGLKPKGEFYLLLPYKRASEFEKLVKKENLFVEKRLLVSPSVLHSPFRVLVKGSLIPVASPKINHLNIRDEQQQYTQEFIDLLKDYYLYL